MASETTQEATPMQAKPQAEHHWLQKLLGDWEYEGEATSPDGDTVKSSGTESVRALGDLWVIAEGRGTMGNGDQDTTVMTLGYDEQSGVTSVPGSGRWGPTSGCTTAGSKAMS
jgi:hypothetical protein